MLWWKPFTGINQKHNLLGKFPERKGRECQLETVTGSAAAPAKTAKQEHGDGAAAAAIAKLCHLKHNGGHNRRFTEKSLSFYVWLQKDLETGLCIPFERQCSVQFDSALRTNKWVMVHFAPRSTCLIDLVVGFAFIFYFGPDQSLKALMLSYIFEDTFLCFFFFFLMFILSIFA